MSDFLTRWHHAVFQRDAQALAALLADDVQFYSPVLFKPKQGKPTVAHILMTVASVFENFTYHRQWRDGGELVLEFSAEVAGLKVKGVDIISLNEAEEITTLEVMVRPANGLMALGEEMARRLAARP